MRCRSDVAAPPAPLSLRSGRVRFPSLAQPATRTLSVVVPAYNEEERMQGGVPEMLTWLKARAAAGPYW